MTIEPQLHIHAPTGPTVAVALVLHGGRENSTAPVRPTDLALLRMRPFATEISRPGQALGIAVAHLRHRVRGWNGSVRSPVADARWALGRLALRFGDVPVALVGHSMGGRTALYVAGTANVRTVIALAPWIEEGDPVTTMTGRALVIAHGDHDRVTSIAASARYARAAAEVAAVASLITVRGARHALLLHARSWHELAAALVLNSLVGAAPDGLARPAVASAAADALSRNCSLVL